MPGTSSKKKAPHAEGAAAVKAPVRMNDFIARPFDEAKGEGWDIIGDYRLRWDSHKGQDRQLPPFSRYVHRYG